MQQTIILKLPLCVQFVKKAGWPGWHDDKVEEGGNLRCDWRNGM